MSTWEEYVSDDTKIMLDQLISINNNVNDLDNTQRNYSKFADGSTFLLTIYALLFLWIQSEENLLFAVAVFFSSVYHLIWLLITASVFFMELNYETQIDKEKSRLENLRLEVIDHLNNTWYINEHSAIRDEISVYMEAHGINVRYKSK